ncbi:rRNA biogenesis protein rrp36 [Penicillium macrosclerotiorum]|uniref:rRNA biogenesis protein rrp36 n=1 Tax=Penicillium macrosclerotiorum TaxID=303699 RepID=UPI002546662C|nr:rRNA biogenesis protein rrp36 [Penicillium macrosclerotiorum]KAJ5669263.1 rRNA biogenesis protein rrp36 [Penicillium macrosclerotiorum]
MAISDKLNRRVRARPDEDEEVYSEDSNLGESQDEGEDGDSDAGDLQSGDSQASDGIEDDDDDDSENSDNAGSDEASSDQEDEDDNFQSSLNNISFGALAKAQASMGPKSRKGKISKSTTNTDSTASPLDDIRARIREAREQKREAAAKAAPSKDARDKKAGRANKHAPMEMSSKRAVSRKRTVVEPPAAAKARDPRFDAAVMGHSGAGKNAHAANKAYAFLDEYRASELKDLKAQHARTKNAEQKEALKKQIRSATDQMKTRENRKREADIMAEHRKQEKQLIREGKKANPYYLKKSDLKKQVMEKKYKEMGSRDRAKALERRRKKMASKERKEMPMERRGMAMGDEPPPRGGKRRRLE